MGGRGASSESKSVANTKEDKAIAYYLKKKGVKVNPDNTVTLYHTTSKENAEKIKKEGFRGNQSPIGGGSVISEEVGDRSFFGFDKKWVEDTWGSTGNVTLKIKVPARFVRQGAKNDKEVYIEGNIKNKNGVWIPDRKPTSTFYDRIATKIYEKENQKKAR